MKNLDLSKPCRLNCYRYFDDRGCLEVSLRENDIMPFIPKQILTSYCYKHTLKGLHLNYDMAKMVRVIKGAIIDIAVNFNNDTHQLKSYDFLLTPEDNWFYIPSGYGHGMIFLEESIVEYLLSEPYEDKNCQNIRLIDPMIKYSLTLWNQLLIDLPKYIMSDKDKNAIGVKEWLLQ